MNRVAMSVVTAERPNRAGVPAYQTSVSRQLDFEDFQAAHERERQELQALNARESGREFAAVMVARREYGIELSESAKQRSLKRYAVPAKLSGEFFAAYSEALRFEIGFQLNCVN